MGVALPGLQAAAATPGFTALGISFDYTLRNVIFGSAVLGAVGGAIGCFAVLRRQSLLGDALAHAALPGICVAFLLTGTKGSLALLVGAAISGWLGTLAVLGIVRGSRVKEDAALGIVLSVFFGLGALLLSRIRQSGDAGQSGLDRFLFGQAASLVADDVRLMLIVGGAALLAVAALFKEFKLLAFDADFGASIGYPPTRLSIGLTTLIVLAVVIGLQTVGVILMVTVLIAPALAARQWTDRLGTMVVLAGVFGASTGILGSILSSEIARLPTGPTIVLLATALVAVSLLFAPTRGIVWEGIARRRQGRNLRPDAGLVVRPFGDPLGATSPGPDTSQSRLFAGEPAGRVATGSGAAAPPVPAPPRTDRTEATPSAAGRDTVPVGSGESTALSATTSITVGPTRLVARRAGPSERGSA